MIKHFIPHINRTFHGRDYSYVTAQGLYMDHDYESIINQFEVIDQSDLHEKLFNNPNVKIRNK